MDDFMIEFKKQCPKCSRDMIYTGKWAKFSLNKSIKKNLLCEKCKSNLGRKHTKNARENMSIAQKDRYSNINEKEKLSTASKKAWNNPIIKRKYYDALIRTKFLGRRCDIGQLELIEKWNKLGFNFQPNYQLRIDTDLFYIDGYDKERNVVLEYDGKYHKKLQQKQKDLIRQQKIIDILKPKKFWRYDVVNKVCKNVL